MSGGAGFIGSHLVKILVERNKVVVFDNFVKNSLAHQDVADSANLTIIRGDILDRASLTRAMRGCSVVIHCAAVIGPETVTDTPSATIDVNFLGSRNLLYACLGLEHLKRVVIFSSSEVYGRHAPDAREDEAASVGSVHESRWSYAASKLLTEHLAFALYKERGLPVVSIRPFNFYGPFQDVFGKKARQEHAVAKMVAQALMGRPVTVYGRGDDVRAWCYISDAVSGILACLASEKAVGEVFNIGNPSASVTAVGLAETIIEALNSRSEIAFVERPVTEVGRRAPNIDKARLILGFGPAVGLRDGIDRIIEKFV